MKKTTKLLTLIVTAMIMLSLCGTFTFVSAVSVSTPKKITVVPVSDSVTIQWSEVEEASGYRVYKKIDGKWKKIASQKQTTYIADNLTASTTYEFGIKTYRKAEGKTYWSNLKTVKTKTKAMPDAKAPTGTSTEKTITLKWDKVAGATGYRVYQYKSKKWVKIASITTNKYTVKSLKSATSYKFKIKPYAKTDSGTVWGDSSKSATIKTVDPTQTKITYAKAYTQTVSLKWSKVSGATGYRVSVLEKGEWKRVKSTSSLSYKVTKLDSNKEYTFMVRAYKKVKGKVTWYAESEPVTVVTAAKDGDLKAYRIEKYQKIFNSDEYLVRMVTQDADLGEAPVELAIKDGNLSMKASVEGMEARIVYNKKRDKAYMIIDSMFMYAEMSKQDLDEMGLEEIMTGLSINNVGDITVTKTVYDGKNAICESYVDTASGTTVKYYFVADVLIAGETVAPDGSKEVIRFEKIESSVSSSVFDRPPLYYIDISSMM